MHGKVKALEGIKMVISFPYHFFFNFLSRNEMKTKLKSDLILNIMLCSKNDPSRDTENGSCVENVRQLFLLFTID